MSESLDAVREQLTSAYVHENVDLALFSHDIGTTAAHYWRPSWSQASTAYSQACFTLNESPYERLIDEALNAPDGLPTQERLLVELLNSSLKRNSNAPYQFEERRTRYFANICAQAEEKFAYTLGHTNGGNITPQPHKQDLYIDDDSEPVLFTKGKDVITSISMAAIAINGVEHPAGTILRVSRNRRSEPLYKDEAVRVFNIDDVDTIHPLRLSLFAIPRAERPSVVQPYSVDEHPEDREELQNCIAYPEIHELGRWITRHVSTHIPYTSSQLAVV